MKIRSILVAGTITTVVLTLLSISAALLFVIDVQRTYDFQKIVEAISEKSFQSTLLRQQYLMHPNGRAKEQWIHLYEGQVQLLRDSRSLFTSESEKQLFTQFEESLTSNRPLFQKLVGMVEQGSSDTVIQELNNQMELRALIRTALIKNLFDVHRAATVNSNRILLSIIAVVGWLAFGISVGLFLVSRKISRSIGMLAKGVKIISSGDLTYRISVSGKDEIAILARSFNDMAVNLLEYRNKIEERVQERTLELQKANIFLDAIIDNIPNMIFLKDAKELRFVRLNKAGEELLGYDRKDLIGKNDFDFFPKEQAVFFTQKDREVCKHGQLSDIPEEQINTKFKGKRWLHTKKIPLHDMQGEPEYLLGISEDITERIQMDKTKMEFVSLASHQLRTPLTIIRWSLEKLMQSISTLEPSMQKKLRASYSGTLRMSEIINTLLAVGRINSGKIAVHDEAVAVEPLLRKIFDEWESLWLEKSATLSIDCAPYLLLQTDPDLLREIIENLVSNALKYTPESGNVRVRAGEKDGWLELTVQDTGLGIPIDQQSRIFEKFFRADNILDVDPDGIGLGLYLTYAFAGLLGGTLTFQSVVNEGTTFTLRLPLSSHE